MDEQKRLRPESFECFRTRVSPESRIVLFDKRTSRLRHYIRFQQADRYWQTGLETSKHCATITEYQGRPPLRHLILFCHDYLEKDEAL